MARVKIVLDIEEADLEQFKYVEGCALPTRVIKLEPHSKPGTKTFYRLQHATNEDAPMHALPYKRAHGGDYPSD